MSVLFERAVIIGVGLIGGSLARAMKKNALCKEIIGCDRNTAELDQAIKLNVIDRGETNIDVAVKNADLIVLATPVGSMHSIFDQLKKSCPSNAVLTDVGSVKRSVIDDARRVFESLPPGFVPGHPIAGTEKNGVSASISDLFENRCVILTPVPESAAWAVEKTRRLWTDVGAEVVMMDADHHDEVLAATSHLPHVLAFNLVDTLGRMHERSEIFKFAAGGFRDFTRIASSNPQMWRDICLANRRAMLTMIDRYSNDLQQLRSAIETQDANAIETIFARAQQLRNKYVVK